MTSRWDDNVTELSTTDRNRVENPAYADRFKIETAGDWAQVPSVRAGWSHELVPQRETQVWLDARVARYLRDTIKDYEVVNLRLSQELSRSRRWGTRLVLRGGYMPGFYLRELTVPQASLEQGNTVRGSAQFDETSGSIAVQQVLKPKLLELTVRYGSESRDYDAPFDERDGDLSGWQALLDYNPGVSRRFSAQAGFRITSYNAHGDRPVTPALEPDISSDRFAVVVGADARWGKRGRRGSVSLELTRESRDFTSADPNDAYHFNRDDTLVEAALTVRQAVSACVYLEAGLSRETNDSRLAPGAPTSGGDEVTDYTRDIVSVAVGWRH